MSDVTGGTPPIGSSEFRPHTDIAQTYAHFGASAMFAVADAASLPSSGNWAGRLLMTEDTDAIYKWSGSAWVLAQQSLQATAIRASGTHNIESTDSAYTWSGVTSDSGSGFWDSGSPTRMVAPVSGRYLISAGLKAGSGACEIEYRPRVNGSVLTSPTFAFSAGDPASTAWPRVWGSFEVDLTAADYVELFVRKLGGTDSTVIPTETFMQMRLLP